MTAWVMCFLHRTPDRLDFPVLYRLPVALHSLKTVTVIHLFDASPAGRHDGHTRFGTVSFHPACRPGLCPASGVTLLRITDKQRASTFSLKRSHRRDLGKEDHQGRHCAVFQPASPAGAIIQIPMSFTTQKT